VLIEYERTPQRRFSCARAYSPHTRGRTPMPHFIDYLDAIVMMLPVVAAAISLPFLVRIVMH